MSDVLTSPALKLSILDLCQVFPEMTPQETMANSIEVAMLADELGYSRYWFAEHHNAPTVMNASPAIMATRVGAVTKQIHVGAGGVMMPNHAPLRIAEDYAMLETLFPGRADLGLGRAPGTNLLAAKALRKAHGGSAEDFPQMVEELMGFLQHDFSPAHPYHSIKATASPTLLPNVLVLGSSTGGMQVASEQGLPFVFATHLNPHLTQQALATYRADYRPSKRYPEPLGILSVIVIVADTDEEAEYIAAPAVLQWAQIFSGVQDGVRTIEDANRYIYSEREARAKRTMAGSFVIGSQASVGEQLRQLASENHVSEIIIMDMYRTLAHRKHAYKLLADEFQLPQA